MTYFYRLPFCRMSSISDSFIPSAIKMWNSLKKMYIRNVDTLSKFKSELKKIDEPGNHVVPKHYIYRPRKLNVENPSFVSELRFISSRNCI